MCTIFKKIHILVFYVISAQVKQLTERGKVLSSSVEQSLTWHTFADLGDSVLATKTRLTSRSFETLATLGNEIFEDLQGTRRLFRWDIFSLRQTHLNDTLSDLEI